MIRHLLTDRSPKYGNDDDYADEIMKEVFRSYREAVTGRPNSRGGQWRINMLPTTCHVYFGEVMELRQTEGWLGNRCQREFHRAREQTFTGRRAVIRSASKMDPDQHRGNSAEPEIHSVQCGRGEGARQHGQAWCAPIQPGWPPHSVQCH